MATRSTKKHIKEVMSDGMLFRNVDAPLKDRIEDLIGRLSVEEKIGLLTHESPAIDRLDIPFYSWWGEALHGHARGGKATVFPQAVGLAATFDPDLMERIARAIGDETRAKYHAALRADNRTQFLVLTHMSPTINILRDPRWGRNQETYGEDPYLTATLGCAFVRGLQGDDPHYLKAAAFAKHFAVHSGPEENRYAFNALVNEKDLQETYLYAFRQLVEVGVGGIMGSYNAVNGEPCCVSQTLLTDNLKQRWGFEGTVISDGGGLYWARAKGDEKDAARKAIDEAGFALDRADWSTKHQRQSGHGIAEDSAEISAIALKNGCDLEIGSEFKNGLAEALERGLVDEDRVDAALRRVLKLRFRLGMFDPDDRVPYAATPESVVHCGEHVQLAYRAAVESAVLLKNENDALPLSPNIKSVLVGGPNAANIDSLLGSYYGQSPRMVTLMEGVTNNISPATSMIYTRFCPIEGGVLKKKGWKQDRGRPYDGVIAAMGWSPMNEGEAGGDPEDSLHDGDRPETIGLPGHQIELLKSLKEHGEKLVVVLFGGSPVECAWAMENADAVIFAFYPGEQGGQAIADVIFGKAAPSGRMPFTTPRSLDDLPPFHEYALTGRTYRYMEKEPLIPFGFGLTYTRFAYASPTVSAQTFAPGDTLRCTVRVKNTGERTGDEVVQLYVTHHDAPGPQPKYALKGIRRVTLNPGASADVAFELTDKELSIFDQDGREIVRPGRVTLTVGGACPDPRAVALGAAEPVKTEIEIKEH